MGLHRLVVLAAALAAVLLVPAVALAAESETVTIKAEGMYCVNCEARVESAVAGLDGVMKVTADKDTETAKVTYDPDKVTPEDMVAAIDNHTAYVGGLPDEGDDTAAATSQTSGDGSSSSTGDTSSSSDDGGTQTAQFTSEQSGASPQQGAGVLPGGGLIAAVGAAALLALGGGAWVVARR